MYLAYDWHNILKQISSVSFTFGKEVDEVFTASFYDRRACISEKFGDRRGKKTKCRCRVVPFFLVRIFVGRWNLRYEGLQSGGAFLPVFRDCAMDDVAEILDGTFGKFLC